MPDDALITTPPPPPAGGFTGLDWAVLAAYFVVLALTGWWLSRRENTSTDDYFLGGRKMPTWAVAVSIVATSMSAASFIGVPQQGYTGDLTYLSTNVGMVIAAVVVAFVFMPAFYRKRVQSIYELLDQRFGRTAMQATSGMYMLGRVMASGVRVYIGAIPASIILFGLDKGMEPQNLCVAIGVLTVIGIVYTLVGGIASVIWTDVIQMGILLGACVVAILVILNKLPIGIGEGLEILAHPGGSEVAADHATAASKLVLFDLGGGASHTPWWARPFSLPAVLIGFTIMGIASYGTDQDMTQRMLTCRDEKAAARSVIGGILFGIPSVALFLVVGLLLYLFYQRPEIWPSGVAPVPTDDSRGVFLGFILTELPAGVSGLMIAGLFAAGLSSLNSGVNAMASTAVNDFWRRIAPGRTEKHYLFAGRVAVVGWGLVLGAFAVLCVFWEQQHARQNPDSGSTLLTFALQVMTFTYAGLVAVFLTVLLTKRGSTAGVIAALATGFVLVLLMQPVLWDLLVDLDTMRAKYNQARSVYDNAPRPLLLAVIDLAFVWKLTIASTVAFVVIQALPAKRPTPGRDRAAV